MKMSMNTQLLFVSAVAAAFSSGEARAQVKFAPAFSDGVVIQRGARAPVWGEASPNAAVEVQLGPQRRSGRADGEGRWQVAFDSLAAGGPFTLSARSGGSVAEVKDVLAGDVWLCSGQSNMQMSLKESAGGAALVADAGRYKTLRLLQMGRGGDANPQSKMGAKWKLSTPETARDFSAVAYDFAMGLLQDPKLRGVPIGLIDSSFGGTAIEAWTPREGLEGVGPDQMSGSMFGIGASTLYNGMISPLAPLGLRGVVWYQGEANAGKPQQYAALLASMIGQWRQKFASPQLPFLIVQLPPFSGKMGDQYFTWVREAEARAARAVPNTWMAVTLGTHDGSDLHPVEKKEVGDRLALLARRHVYNSSVVADSPAPRAITVQGPQVLVAFETGGGKLVDPDGGLVRGFALAGEDGEYHYAQARIQGPDSVVVESEQVQAPRTVRYAWGPAPESDLRNEAGLPAEPFRSDSQPPESYEFQRQPAVRAIETRAYQVTVDGQGKVTSLGAGGEQFLSNALGGGGGTTVPGAFGPRNLPFVSDLGPRSIAARDGQARLQISCGESSMKWTLSCLGKESFEFRVNLAPEVEVVRQGPDVELKRGSTRIKVTGVEQAEGHTLIVKPQPGKPIELTWTVMRAQ